MAVLSKIFIYPIKALLGVTVDKVEITAGGSLKNDRRWAMFDKNGKAINGKNSNKVFLLKAEFDLNNEQVTFNTGEPSALKFDLADTKPLATYLSEQLNTSVRLLENRDNGFPDDPEAYGPTLISEASLIAVQSWFPTLSLAEIRARFRINLEVSDVPVFWEDKFFVLGQEPKKVQVGNVLIEATNPCARCSVPTKNPNTGKKNSQFYQTFVRNREAKKAPWTDAGCFDHWYRLSINTKVAVSEAKKNIHLGDTVSIV